MSSILSQRRLRFLGHLAHMDNSRLPKKLLVYTLVGGSHAVGGQKCRWNDVVLSDLRRCGLEEDWRAYAQNRRMWRHTIKEHVENLNNCDEQREKQ